jgi:Holliday junction resolvase RusA-like endonuclease
MSAVISFFAPGIPEAQPRAKAQIRRFGNKTFAHVYTPGTAENWKSCIAAAAKPYVPAEPITGPVQVDCTFTLPRLIGHYGTGKNAGKLKESAPQYHVVKPDLDNAMKCVWDVIVYLRFIMDDTQICKSWSEKIYENPPALKPGCQITIVPLENKAVTSAARFVLGDAMTPTVAPKQQNGEPQLNLLT